MRTCYSAQPIIEAVPNFSEGRRDAVVDAIVAAVQAPGVLLLDRTSDRDHNRSVVTIAGPPTAVLEGLFRAVGMAAEKIDLFQHTGVHPRLGATDVVPLVPIRNCTLADCAALAVNLARRVGDELELPVYLYAAAAMRPERRNLADVRRGEFERLAKEIDRPERRPDFGPARVGPAGAVTVGARKVLIAINFYLETDDVAVARSIARKIRASSGGLPGVKALGLLVDEKAQVSVNLVDHTQTGLHKLTDTIERLAQKQGTRLARTELIGLAPQDAILDAAANYLRLPSLAPGQLIETAIDQAASGMRATA